MDEWMGGWVDAWVDGWMTMMMKVGSWNGEMGGG